MAVSPTRVTMKALRAARRFRFPVPETNQQVTADAHALPSEEQEQQVGAQQQRAHRGDKQVHVGEETAVTLILTHVFG